MPDFKNRNAKYDAMSTDELQALLREDASKPEGEETNMEVLFYVMEVLAKRRQARQEGKTPEEALDSFVKNYMPEVKNASSSESEPTGRKHKPVVRRWTRGLVAAAAVIVLVMGTSFTASAFGFDLWEIVAKWTQQTFHLSYINNDNYSEAPKDQNENALGGLQDTLKYYGVPENIVPTFLPDGYVETDVKVQDTPKRRQFTAQYLSDDKTIRIRIADYLDGAPTQIEYSDGLIEVYSSVGIDYYIFDNEGQMQALWVNDRYECYLSGSLTLSELKEIIDSIGKDE